VGHAGRSGPDRFAPHTNNPPSRSNAAPTLPLSKLPFAILRVACDEPPAGATIDPSECTVPFTSTQGLHPLLDTLGVIKIFDRLSRQCVERGAPKPPPVLPARSHALLFPPSLPRRRMADQRGMGPPPTPVLVPIAAVSDAEPGVPLRAMLFLAGALY
jgi:hypothetical protein